MNAGNLLGAGCTEKEAVEPGMRFTYPITIIDITELANNAYLRFCLKRLRIRSKKIGTKVRRHGTGHSWPPTWGSRGQG